MRSQCSFCRKGDILSPCVFYGSQTEQGLMSDHLVTSSGGTFSSAMRHKMDRGPLQLQVARRNSLHRALTL